jgi:hypothetical protein
LIIGYAVLVALLISCVDFYQDMKVKDIGVDDAESDICTAQRPIGVRHLHYVVPPRRVDA